MVKESVGCIHQSLKASDIRRYKRIARKLCVALIEPVFMLMKHRVQIGWSRWKMEIWDECIRVREAEVVWKKLRGGSWM